MTEDAAEYSAGEAGRVTFTIGRKTAGSLIGAAVLYFFGAPSGAGWLARLDALRGAGDIRENVSVSQNTGLREDHRYQTALLEAIAAEVGLDVAVIRLGAQAQGEWLLLPDGRRVWHDPGNPGWRLAAPAGE